MVIFAAVVSAPTPVSMALWKGLLLLAILGTLSSCIFLGMVLVAAARRRHRSRVVPGSAKDRQKIDLPFVTVLKPVHGTEPRLEENLGSFFEQDYPDFEIIVGLRDNEDAALEVAERIRQRHPTVRSRIVLSGPPVWPSAKVFSLDKMISVANGDFFVISDSDILAPVDFLRNVIPPILNPRVGLVTCLYQGIPARGMWSLLEGLGMSVEMASGVIVAEMLEGMRFALGAVMVVRRDALEVIGGISTTANYYSDDFVLGNRIWAAGYEVVLSDVIVGHVLVTRSFLETFADQLRWMKSTRYSRPRGHVGTALTYAMPFGLVGLVSASACGHPALGSALLLLAVANRLIQCLSVGWGVLGDPRAIKYCWLYPLRDLLGFCTWFSSFIGHDFQWRGESYRFSGDGKIVPQRRPTASVLSTNKAGAKLPEYVP